MNWFHPNLFPVIDACMKQACWWLERFMQIIGRVHGSGRFEHLAKGTVCKWIVKWTKAEKAEGKGEWMPEILEKVEKAKRKCEEMKSLQGQPRFLVSFHPDWHQAGTTSLMTISPD
jgi:hypothetical protein